MDRNIHFLVLLITQIYTCHAGEWCYSDSYEYCEHGCCNERCCAVEVWLIWAIVGGVIGGILLISLFICLICVGIKHKGKPGRVIQPFQGVQPPVYFSNQAYPQAHGMYQQTPYYPQQPTAPPPAYTPSSGNFYSDQLPPLPRNLQDPI